MVIAGVFHRILRFIAEVAVPGLDCVINLPQKDAQGKSWHIVPKFYHDGVAVAWQTAESILLQTFDHNCHAHTDAVEVNRSTNFWQNADDGLSDLTSLDDHRFIVVWSLDGQMWASVLDAKSGSQINVPVQTADASVHHARYEARVISSPSCDGGFFVAWSSWGEDGDGWGVFARQFSSTGWPTGEQRRVNQARSQFQWHPQLASCGESIWALWENGTGSSCDSRGKAGLDCRTGPLIRQLLCDMDSSPEPHEIKMPGVSPIMAALACATVQDALVFWWNQDQASPTHQVVNSSSNFAQETYRKVNASRAAQRKDLNESVQNHALLGLNTISEVEKLHAPAESFTSVLPGQSIMLADGNSLLTIECAISGMIQVQLWDSSQKYVTSSPKREVAAGATSVSAALDASSQVFIICWSAERMFGTSDTLTCAQHRLEWLSDTSNTGLGGDVALVAFPCFVILLSCSRRSCSRTCCVECLARCRGALQRPSDRLRGTQLNLLQQRLAPSQRGHTRTQNAPQQSDNSDMHPPARSEEQSFDIQNACSDDSGDHSTAAASPNILLEGVAGICPRCRCPVSMWVAVQKCGHTACRECIRSLQENNSACFVCSAPIEGTISVYI